VSAKKVCVIVSFGDYPSSRSLVSILEDVLGYNRIVVVRHKGWRISRSLIFRPLAFLFQDAVISLSVLRICRKENLNAILIFQGYFPILITMSKLLGIKSFLFSGGSNYWGYFEATSTIAKVFSYANIPIQKVCHRFLDVLITLSPNVMNEISFEVCRDKARFAVARVDADFYNKFRIVKNYKQRSNIVGYLGLLCRRKGILNLVHAVPSIIERKSDCKFVVIGGGPLLETVRMELQNFGLSGSVAITGFADYNSLEKQYNEMKLLILPSHAEGIPSVILEAMACGTPVVATPVGGIPDVIKNGETGFLLKSIDPKRIADRITKLLNDPELLEKVSANAFKYVRENFNEEKILQSWRRIFQDSGILTDQKRKNRENE